MSLSHLTLTPSWSDVSIPALGLGTFEPNKGDDPDKCSKAVTAGLKAGYRHIDTAALYACEEQVGKGIRESGVKREEVFVCTKL